jgi:hypothetical protein
MWIVGNSLKETAATEEPAKADLFGRSALNRFYYAVFLEARKLVRRVDPKWATPTHADLPLVLKGRFFEVFENHLMLLSKGGELEHGERLRRVATVRTALEELADLLTMAREVRRIADYEPETLMEIKNGELGLGGTTLPAAMRWQGRAEGLLKVVYRSYVEFAIIKF